MPPEIGLSVLAREFSDIPEDAGDISRARNRCPWGAKFSTGLRCACVAGTSILWVFRGVEISLKVVVALGIGLSVLVRELSETSVAAGDDSRARSRGPRGAAFTEGLRLLDVTRELSATTAGVDGPGAAYAAVI